MLTDDEKYSLFACLEDEGCVLSEVQQEVLWKMVEKIMEERGCAED